MGVPVAIAPTIASTDAPCSAVSVIYTDEGEFDRYLLLPNNPNMVIVDNKIVAGAPARLLAAGIGDALSTWIEARACSLSGATTIAAGKCTHAALALAELCYNTLLEEGEKAMIAAEQHVVTPALELSTWIEARACSLSGATTIAAGKCTHAALALAELCYNTLLEEGEKAMIAAEQHVVTPALERVIEANTYLSGVGFVSGGMAAAVAVHNGLTAFPDANHYFHGVKVAFGTLSQLVAARPPRRVASALRQRWHWLYCATTPWWKKAK